VNEFESAIQYCVEFDRLILRGEMAVFGLSNVMSIDETLDG
jgi:hypothetical protein